MNRENPRRTSSAGRWRAVRSGSAILGVSLIMTALLPLVSHADTGSVGGSQGVNPEPGPTPSQVIVHGHGTSSGITVTVNQTADLTNQPISVKWTGAVPTTTGGTNGFNGRFDNNFMQVFQCWGDPSYSGVDPAVFADDPGPSPTQCEAGAASAKNRVYPISDNQVSAVTRVVAYPGNPNYDRYKAMPDVTADPSGFLFESFHAVDGTAVPISENPLAATNGNANLVFWLNPYFSYNDTNEIDFGRTFPDGTGSQLFITDTGLEAPGLGCGQQVQPVAGGGKKAPQCWLVLVPQTSVAVSPVNPDAWANRIAIPISFRTVDSPCTFGKSERRLAGSEMASGAVASWQPTLCAQSGSLPYSYAALGDSLARTQLPSAGANDAQTAVMTYPLDPAGTDPADPPVYAPITLSSEVIAFNIERVPTLDSTGNFNAVESPYATTRVGHIHLTPRLVAKLLTQSYAGQFANSTTLLKQEPWATHNAGDLLSDPDFQQFNPEFAYLKAGSGIHSGQLLVSFANSDAAAILWHWIAADPEAMAWLEGVPDPWGMVVDPWYSTYAGNNPSGAAFVPAQQSGYPKSNPFCGDDPHVSVSGSPVLPLCTLAYEPYASSMFDAARRTYTTDSGSRTTPNFQAATANQYYIPDGGQTAGSKSILSVTDSASAARYGLPTAELSQAGDDGSSRTFVAADDAGVLAAEQAMQPAPGVPGVVVPNPATRTAGAYPLGLLTYAATIPGLLDPTAAASYARFVDYAAGAGQSPGTGFGQLPPGYTPLPAALRSAALAAAAAVVKASATAPAPAPTPATTSPTGPATPPTPPSPSADAPPAGSAGRGSALAQAAAGAVPPASVAPAATGDTTSSTAIDSAPIPAAPAAPAPAPPVAGTAAPAKDKVAMLNLARTAEAPVAATRWLVPFVVIVALVSGIWVIGTRTAPVIRNRRQQLPRN